MTEPARQPDRPSGTTGLRAVGVLSTLTQVAWPVICGLLAWAWADALWARGVILVGLWVVGGTVLWWASTAVSSWIHGVWDRRRER